MKSTSLKAVKQGGGGEGGVKTDLEIVEESGDEGGVPAGDGAVNIAEATQAPAVPPRPEPTQVVGRDQQLLRRRPKVLLLNVAVRRQRRRLQHLSAVTAAITAHALVVGARFRCQESRDAQVDSPRGEGVSVDDLRGAGRDAIRATHAAVVGETGDRVVT